jgi:hypothetical protein
MAGGLHILTGIPDGLAVFAQGPAGDGQVAETGGLALGLGQFVRGIDETADGRVHEKFFHDCSSLVGGLVGSPGPAAG